LLPTASTAPSPFKSTHDVAVTPGMHTRAVGSHCREDTRHRCRKPCRWPCHRHTRSRTDTAASPLECSPRQHTRSQAGKHCSSSTLRR
jgi:hypothetical protein